jgi:hypothetical protein
MKLFPSLSQILFTSTVSGILLFQSNTAQAATLWNTLQANSAIAFSSQLDIPTETADDFTVTGDGFTVTNVSFLGLFSEGDAKIDEIDLAFYEVFPGSSDLTRTPVTVRTNGPEDVEFAAFGTADKQLTFTTTDLGKFTVDQTIVGGSGANTPGLGSGVLVDKPYTGYLKQIDVQLTTPLTLAPQPVFLVAAVDPSSGDYFAVAGDRPPTSPDPLPAGVVDRQAWFRTNEPFDNALEPDWVRISDVINQEDGTAEPSFNTAFAISGEPVPEPSEVIGTLAFVAVGAGLGLKRQLKQKQSSIQK